MPPEARDLAARDLAADEPILVSNDDDDADDQDGGDQDGGDGAPEIVASFTSLDADPQARPKGVEVIAAAVRLLPDAPGVYRMIGDDEEVLYVGKARNLKKRVVSYTRAQGLSTRILRMTQATRRMEFIITRTETEALLLEANLIKRLRPHFNVLMRDDKSFPYILITGDHAAPMLTKHRGARDRKGRYFGPFASTVAVKRTIDALQKAFLVRSCSDSVYDARTRPCLLYQIKRCAAPCTGEISAGDYRDLVEQATSFLSGRSAEVQQKMAALMQAASDAWDFERAARFRDQLAALSHVSGHQGINPAGVEEADLFAAFEESGQVCIQVFFFRTGQNWGNHAFFPRIDKGMELSEIMASFIGQFYDNKPVPRLVLVSHDFEDRDLLARALSEKAGHKVEVAEPRRGEKRDLVEHAIDNAKEALGRRMADSASQARLLEGVQRIFNLPAPPRRIEIYDNSHIQGSNAVGCMVVAGPDGFMKGQYRKFNIKSAELTPGDDFAMMREMLTRRFTRLVKEVPDRNARVADDDVAPWPDLVLIDGGRGQLQAVRGVLEEIGITDLPLVGVAKGAFHGREGREKFHLPGKPDFLLPERDPVLYFIQRLRDEAHRFAIGTHRAKRAKEMSRGTLEEIPGVGPTRKRALLNHFGTLKAIQGAAREDIAAVPGISATTADVIWAYFQG